MNPSEVVSHLIFIRMENTILHITVLTCHLRLYCASLVFFSGIFTEDKNTTYRLQVHLTGSCHECSTKFGKTSG